MSNIDEPKTAKQRYFDKVYREAPLIQCKCGCGTMIKSKDKYARDKVYVSGHNGRKYEDPSQYKREWNHRNRAARYQANKSFSHKRKVEFLGLLGGKCQMCDLEYSGENACVFDFHHRDPSDKKISLSSCNLKNYAKAVLLEELAKCDLLCANCHRTIHSSKY